MSTGVLSPSFAPAAPGRFSGTRWIISRRDDLVWFVGTALVGYLALGLMLRLNNGWSMFTNPTPLSASDS